MFIFINCNITIISSTFIDNDVHYGQLLSVINYHHGAVELPVTSIIPLVSTLTIIDCEFRNNSRSNYEY